MQHIKRIRYPGHNDRRLKNGIIVPIVKPKFKLEFPAKVFTIGSCFARNIEEALAAYDVCLPTVKFASPATEWAYRPNGILNQFNPGTISQVILSGLDNELGTDETIVSCSNSCDQYVDLLLPNAALPVSKQRALERRIEINSIYSGGLQGADLVIMTLGLVESWYDDKAQQYLNRMPSIGLVKKKPNRYSIKKISVSRAVKLLEGALQPLMAAGVNKILLTLSPVPLSATFFEVDAVMANSYSKAVLRVVIELLVQKYDEIDYFPSFEIVQSAGLAAFESDNIHVKSKYVEMVTANMIEHYFTNS